MKKNLKLDMKYAGAQVFYFAAFCSMMGYASVYLLDKGFSNSTIGIILALVSVIAVFTQPMIASFADSHEKIELRTIINWVVVIAIAFSIVLYLFPVNLLIIGVLVVTIFTLMNTIMPLMNSLAFVFEKYGIEINYGLARGLGSVAYAVTSLILGHVVDIYNPSLLPLFYIGFNVLLYIIVKVYVLPKNQNYEVVEVEKNDNTIEQNQLSMIGFFAKYKKLMFMLCGFVFIYFAHTIINNFFIQIITSVNGSSSDMGNAIFLAAMLELPTMAYFTKLSEKVNCGTLIKISAIMFLAKHVITFFAANMMMIYVAQIMQMGAYALFIPASVYYVNNKVGLADRVKGQSMVTMAMTLSGVFANLVGGILLDAIGVHEVLLVGAVLSVIGVAIMMLTTEKV